MSREVDEERLSDLFGIGFGLPEIEEPFEPVRQVEEVAVFGFEPFDGPQPLSGGRTSRGRAALSCGSRLPSRLVMKISELLIVDMRPTEGGDLS